MSQSHFYPGKNLSDICTSCYTELTQRSSSDCSGDNTTSYCSGTCNTSCNSAQNYGNISFNESGCQTLAEHGDLSFSGFNATQNGIIYNYWTHSKWNELQEAIEDAYNIGQKSSTNQSRDLYFTRVNSNDVITAEQYNQFSKNVRTNFNCSNGDAPLVEKDNTIITKTLSDQLDKLLNNSTFNSSVCDLCNTGSQTNCSYNCSCNYNCCNYNCCNYNCNYNCNNS